MRHTKLSFFSNDFKKSKGIYDCFHNNYNYDVFFITERWSSIYIIYIHNTIQTMVDIKYKYQTLTGNDAAAYVAYQWTDNAMIYPITPSTPMATNADAYSAAGVKNLFGQVGTVVEMQSEAGAAGAVHGSLTTGGFCTTFTASQGLLLMIPNMYKIAGELLPCVFHVAARSVAGQALNIYGDHSDVMAARSTGFAFLASQSVQEAHDMALVAHIATLRSKVPFCHFFDGFRTSHETVNIRMIAEESMKQFVPWEAIAEHRKRSLNPNHPALRGTAQSPDIYFQCVEAGNKYYEKVPEIVDQIFEELAGAFGKRYRLFEYIGAEDATDVIVCMASGSQVVAEAVNYLNKHGSKVGVINCRLYRPWSKKHFLEVLPKTVQRIAVLDRCKDVAASGEPLYLDVSTSVLTGEAEGIKCTVIGGRYGLGCKDFTPGMAISVFENLRSEHPIDSFTVGIVDDVTNKSLPIGIEHDTIPEGTWQAIMWGLGSDGTVSVSKTLMKILGDHASMNVQGYSEYEAKKSNGYSINYLRYGKTPITSPYLVKNADYVSCSKDTYIQKYDILNPLKNNGIFLLNTQHQSLEELEAFLPNKVKKQIAKKHAKFYICDATGLAQKFALGKYVNTTMATIYFKISGCMPVEEGVGYLKQSIEKTYMKKGEAIVKKNFAAVDESLSCLIEINYPESWADLTVEPPKPVEGAIDFVNNVQMPMFRYEGDNLPVSKFTPGGEMPSGTSKYEKRGLAYTIPTWNKDKCTQCNQCSVVCPHAAIRPFLVESEELKNAPESFETIKAMGNGVVPNYNFRIQVSPLDCTGCSLCIQACGDDAIVMKEMEPQCEVQSKNWEYGMSIKNKADNIPRSDLKHTMFHTPLLEFSGACDGCGETPYVKLITQLFGERMIIANATGCSSIWGGTAAFNPYTTNQKGQGPAWGNSLFEDNAEYGLGMATTTAQRRRALKANVEKVLKEERDTIEPELADLFSEWLMNYSDSQSCQKVAEAIMAKLSIMNIANASETLKYIISEKELLPKISQWIIGGDGWAYDIGYGGVDHVLSTGEDVNIVVLDTEMYSNTGGQKSKATPLSAKVQFAAGGKRTHKKEMGLMAMSYKNVYVASVALYADMSQTLRAFAEAEAYSGPSIIFCYAPCLMQNVVPAMRATYKETELAVKSGYWPLYRYDPRLEFDGKIPFQLDYQKELSDDLKIFLSNERRFLELNRAQPKLAEELHADLKQHLEARHLDFIRKALPMSKLQSSVDNAKGPMVTVLYGSATGNAKLVAEGFVNELEKRSCGSELIEMNDITPADLAAKTNVVVIVSTAGQGDFPSNAENFWEAINKEDIPKDLLKNVHFSVFGLGDSNYAKFCLPAKEIDATFEKLGATRVSTAFFGNDQDADRYMTAYEEWEPSYFESMKIEEPVYTEAPASVYKVETKEADSIPISRRRIILNDFELIPLVKKERMTPADYDRNIMHLEFDLSRSNIHYKAGDALAIYPKNNAESVKEMCEYLNATEETIVTIHSSEARFADKFPKATTVGKLMGEVLDINGRCTKGFLNKLSLFATSEEDKTELKNLTSCKEKLEEFNKECYSYLEAIKMFKSIKIDVAHLLELIPVIKARLYSIASSPNYHEKQLHLCIVQVDWKTPKGVDRHGLCTSYLDRIDLAEGPVQVGVAVRSSAMKIPEDPKTPVIMAGLGTGVAPFRSFVEERAYEQKMGKEVGQSALYLGLRYEKTEFLYGEQFTEFVNSGKLTYLRPAFSRDQAKKVYIQNKIEDEPEIVYKLLVEQAGNFYFCGPAGAVPNAIEKAIVGAIVKCGNKTEEEAIAFINGLKENGKYVVEAWS
ncbi:hypothetical protein WA158_000770 [Blastocystis sp. Blastoise]